MIRITITLFTLCIFFCTPAMAEPRLTIPWKFSEKDIQHGKNAEYWAKKHKWIDAIAHASRAKDPLIRELFLWRKYVTPNHATKFKHITAFIKRHPDWPNQSALARTLERSINSDIPPQRILAWFKNHDTTSLQHYRTPQTTRGKLALLNAIISIFGSSKNYTTEIRNLVSDLWIKGTFTSESEWDFLSKYRKYLQQDDYVKRIDRLIWNGNLSAAKRIINQVSTRHQKLFDARIKLRTNSYGIDAAIKALDPQDLNNSGFLYDRVKWRDKRNRTDGVLKLLKNAPKNDEHAAQWWNIKKKYISKLVEEKKYNSAYTLASKHGFTAKGKNANRVKNADGEWLAGWIAYAYKKDYPQAYKHFSQLYEDVSTPISLSRASYWSSLAAEKNNNTKISKDWLTVATQYPTTYYGQLALAKSGIYTANLNEAKLPTWVDQNHFSNNNFAKAAYILYRARSVSHALKFALIASDRSHTQGEQYLTAQLSKEMGQLDHSIIIAKNALRNSGNFLTDHHYPLLHKILSNKFPVSKGFIHAIIMQESIFNVQAKSHSGALGLMQLMPPTAKDVAKMIRKKYDKKRLYSDAYYNVLLGSHYLKKLLETFDGSYPLTIAAYNGGQGNVRKWIRRNGDPRTFKTSEEVMMWVEKIPFPETRNYVQRVLENMPVFNYKLHNSKKLTITTHKKLLK